jgi:DnaJ-class molecular chaperone
MEQKDYYLTLGLEKDATSQQIKEAYRKLALQYHPDRNEGDTGALEKMKELNEAYAVLSDAEKKGRYDSMRQEFGSHAYDRFRQRYTEQDIFRGSDINQVFEEMARTFGFRGFEDVFEKSYGQGFRTFEFRQPGMFGRGFIYVGSPFGRRYDEQQVSPPQGVFPGVLGKVLNFALKRMLKVGPTEDARDVHDAIALDAQVAEGGGQVSFIDRRTSQQLIIKIPPGVKEGQKIRLRGKGQGGGDLYLSVEIRKPFLEKVRHFLKI